MVTKEQIETLFDKVQFSDYDAFIDQIIELSNAVDQHDNDEEYLWSIGEYGECTLDSLLMGAYWHFTEWHAGQDSKSYAAMCAIGQVFSPGMADGPESESTEEDIYNELNQLAENHYALSSKQ